MKYILDEEEYKRLCDAKAVKKALDEFCTFLSNRVEMDHNFQLGPDGSPMLVTFSIPISDWKNAVKKLKDSISP